MQLLDGKTFAFIMAYGNGMTQCLFKNLDKLTILTSPMDKLECSEGSTTAASFSVSETARCKNRIYLCADNVVFMCFDKDIHRL